MFPCFVTNKKDSYANYDLAFALALLKSNALILDIRTPEEFCNGHLCGARSVPTPLPPLSPNQKVDLRNQLRHLLHYTHFNQPIAIYCKKGIRATITKEILNELGFHYVTCIGGVLKDPLKQIMELKMWPTCVCKN